MARDWNDIQREEGPERAREIFREAMKKAHARALAGNGNGAPRNEDEQLRRRILEEDFPLDDDADDKGGDQQLPPPPPPQPSLPLVLHPNDFVAYMPQHNFFFLATREPWPAASIDARIDQLQMLDRAGNPVF